MEQVSSAFFQSRIHSIASNYYGKAMGKPARVYTLDSILIPLIDELNKVLPVFEINNDINEANMLLLHGGMDKSDRDSEIEQLFNTARSIQGEESYVVRFFLDEDEVGIFPWEDDRQRKPAYNDLEQSIANLISLIDPEEEREGLKETPERAARAWEFWTSGYEKDPEQILKVFEDGADNYDEMVVVQDIPFYSHCEHHLAPIFGTATVAYIPKGRIVGLSKLSRLVDMYARRLQVQERMTVEIADAIAKYLNPLGCGVHITARHLCMESRGICQQGHQTVTTALRGCIKHEPDARQEFLSLCKST